MQRTIAKVIISEQAIPSDGYISWPQRLEYLLQRYKDNDIDHLICTHTDKQMTDTLTKRTLCKQPSGQLAKRLFKKRRFKQFEDALASIVAQHDHVIACVVDSVKLQLVLYEMLEKRGWAHKVSFVFYQCGYSYYFDKRESYDRFTRSVSELILLSKHSYHSEFERYPDMPFPVHVLHNPIDHLKFRPVTPEVRQQLRQRLGFDDRKQFIWVSHDKPVKGLQVILEAWKLFYKEEKNAVLNVVGVSREEQIPGVIFRGKIPNKELPEWFQASDICLFSPLRNEGFGLAIAEAISCGCLGITTWGGGVVDFFQEGEHGIAIKEPNFLQSWSAAFDKAILDLPAYRAAHQDDHLKPPPFDTYDEWCANFLNIFQSIEQRLRITN